jgi:hypothetical protein
MPLLKKFNNIEKTVLDNMHLILTSGLVNGQYTLLREPVVNN